MNFFWRWIGTKSSAMSKQNEKQQRVRSNPKSDPNSGNRATSNKGVKTFGSRPDLHKSGSGTGGVRDPSNQGRGAQPSGTRRALARTPAPFELSKAGHSELKRFTRVSEVTPYGTPSEEIAALKRELEMMRASKVHKKEKKKKEKAWYETLGDVAMEWLPKLAPLVIGGLGDYEVKTNSVLARATEDAGVPIMGGASPPVLSNSKSHNIISHREYLGDVISNTAAFTIQTFALNPGLSKTFPWLSPLSNSYQAYRLRGCVFEFNSLATDYAATPNIGYVALASQYDVYDPVFTSKLATLNNEFTVSKKTSQSICHPIECAPDQTGRTQLYVRNGNIGGNGDLRLYDWCNVSICVGGQPATGAVIGELWATYEVEFYKPKLGGDYDQLVGALTSKGTYTNAACLGNCSASGPLPITATTSVMTFPTLQAGTYVIVIYWFANTNVAWAAPTLAYTNCNQVGFYSAPQAGVSCNQVSITVLINVTGFAPTVSLTSGTLPSDTGSNQTMVCYVFNDGAVNLSSGPVIDREPLRLAIEAERNICTVHQSKKLFSVLDLKHSNLLEAVRSEQRLAMKDTFDRALRARNSGLDDVIDMVEHIDWISKKRRRRRRRRQNGVDEDDDDDDDDVDDDLPKVPISRVKAVEDDISRLREENAELVKTNGLLRTIAMTNTSSPASTLYGFKS